MGALNFLPLQLWCGRTSSGIRHMQLVVLSISSLIEAPSILFYLGLERGPYQMRFNIFSAFFSAIVSSLL